MNKVTILSKKQQYLVVTLSVILSLLVVWGAVFGATTISTNIDTGGSLSVSGAATLSSTLAVTSSTTVSILNVSGPLRSGGAIDASTTLAVGGSARFNSGVGLNAVNSVASTLLIGGLTSNPTAADGLFYYNTTDNALMMSDGTNWFGVGSTTSGLTKVGSRLQMTTLASDYFTFGTTTAASSTHTITNAGLSVLTIEATTTNSVPLTLRGFGNKLAQEGNLFQVLNSGSGELFAIDALGNASGTQLTLSSTLWAGGGFISSASSTVNGNLTVSGAINASSSLAVKDRAEFAGGYVSQASSTVTSNFYVGGPLSASSSVAVNSIFASSTAMASTTVAGHWNALTIGAGTSTPKSGARIAAESSGTTTLFLLSTGTDATGGREGACIQLTTTLGQTVRIYATSTFVAGVRIPLYAELGDCSVGE